MRRWAAILAALVLAAGACSDDDDAAVSGSAATSNTVTTTTTTTSTSTTSTSTTTLSQEQQDAMAAAALWDGLDDAWAEGPEAAARYIEAHTFPGFPPEHEECVRPDATPGAIGYRARPETFQADPGWSPDGVGIDLQGRLYSIEVVVRSGTGSDAETAVHSTHVAITDDGGFFFTVCDDQPADDALAYRLPVGAEYVHLITYRSDISEDQRLAGGRQATGGVDWTMVRSFDVDEPWPDGTGYVHRSVDRMAYEIHSAGETRTAWDTGHEDWFWNPAEYYYGPWGYFAATCCGILNLPPEGPRMGYNTSLSFIELPVTPVAPGDTWETRWWLRDLGLFGRLSVTVTSLAEDEVLVSLEGDVEGEGVHGTWGAPYRLDTTGSLVGTARIDAPTGWLRAMSIDVDAEGTIAFTEEGTWTGSRPLAGSDRLEVGVEMPARYSIHIETETIEG